MKKKYEYVAGIDYSLTSPAICIAEIINSCVVFEKCKFYYLKQNKSQGSFDNIVAMNIQNIRMILKGLPNWQIGQ